MVRGGEGKDEYERAPDGPKWTAQSTDEGEGGWERGRVESQHVGSSNKSGQEGVESVVWVK